MALLLCTPTLRTLQYYDKGIQCRISRQIQRPLRRRTQEYLALAHCPAAMRDRNITHGTALLQRPAQSYALLLRRRRRNWHLSGRRAAAKFTSLARGAEAGARHLSWHKSAVSVHELCKGATVGKAELADAAHLQHTRVA